MVVFWNLLNLQKHGRVLFDVGEASGQDEDQGADGSTSHVNWSDNVDVGSVWVLHRIMFF